MLYRRRDFLQLTAAATATAMLPAVAHAAAGDPPLRSRIKAVAFDAFPIFDPRPVAAQAEQLFPGKGTTLTGEWRTRQFEYTWLRVAASRYADFWQITGDSLDFAAAKLQLPLPADKRQQLMNAHLSLPLWPDVPAALDSLKQSGFRIAFLSNFTPAMLDANLCHNGLTGRFEYLLSTDQARTFKPDRRAYQLGIDSLKLACEEILFVAFAGWDAAGAKLFGYPTYWVNRLQLPPEKLGAEPDGAGAGLGQLIQFLA